MLYIKYIGTKVSKSHCLTSKLKFRARDEGRDSGIAVYRTTDGSHTITGRKYATKGEIVVPALDAGLTNGEVTV